ncbi:restriction endonuclease subunit S [Morganella morganii]|uniref:restriction endonuclease subunit S n=1 Tax=Morganella morganii TaxID=582 RepID=UPI00339CB3D6
MAKYKAYPEYKDSGVEWLGEIPSGWLLKKAKYIFQRIQRPLRNIDGVVTAFRDGQVTLRTNRRTDGFTNSVKEIGYQGVRRNDLVIHAMDGFAGAIGVSDSDGKCSPVCSVCIPWKNQSVNMRFYGYLVRQLAVTDYILSLAKGIRERSTEFRFTEFSGLMLPIPPVYEQNQIAAFLDHETAKIDNLIEKQQQLIELLKEKRQAVISHAVTKGLNPDVPMKDSGVEWLGEVPAHWDVLRLKHLVLSLDSGCSVNAADVPIQQGQIGVLKTSCVYTRSFRPDENKTVVSEDLHRVKCPVKKGSIIISRMNTPDLVGASALVDIDVKDIYLPDRLWQTKFSKKFNLIPAYLANFMTIKGFRTQISLVAEGASSSMQNIAKEDYLGINCLLPPFTEQRKITKYLEDKLAYFADLELKASEAVQLLQERRTALISAAVTGKIDVRDWVAPDTQKTEETAA